MSPPWEANHIGHHKNGACQGLAYITWQANILVLIADV